MCACVYVCLYVCPAMCVCVHAYAFLCVHTHVCIWVCTYICMYICACLCLRMYICMWVCCRYVCRCLCVWSCVCLFVCVCGCVFWPTRSVLCAQTSRVIHQGDSTNQIKQETNYSSLHSFGSETQREDTMGGEAKVVSWFLHCWFGTSHQCYIFEEEKTNSSWRDRKQGRDLENSVHHHQHRLGASTFTKKHEHCCMLFKCH